MNSAENANAKNTMPPMIVTVREEKKSEIRQTSSMRERRGCPLFFQSGELTLKRN